MHSTKHSPCDIMATRFIISFTLSYTTHTHGSHFIPLAFVGTPGYVCMYLSRGHKRQKKRRKKKKRKEVEARERKNERVEIRWVHRCAVMHLKRDARGGLREKGKKRGGSGSGSLRFGNVVRARERTLCLTSIGSDAHAEGNVPLTEVDKHCRARYCEVCADCDLWIIREREKEIKR